MPSSLLSTFDANKFSTRAENSSTPSISYNSCKSSANIPTLYYNVYDYTIKQYHHYQTVGILKDRIRQSGTGLFSDTRLEIKK